jgi:hypothetical protein
VLFVCCLLVVPLPPGETAFAVKINNNKISGGGNLYIDRRENLRSIALDILIFIREREREESIYHHHVLVKAYRC